MCHKARAVDPPISGNFAFYGALELVLGLTTME